MSSRNTRFVLNSHVRGAIAFSGLLVGSNDIKKTCTQIREEENVPVMNKDCTLEYLDHQLLIELITPFNVETEPDLEGNRFALACSSLREACYAVFYNSTLK